MGSWWSHSKPTKFGDFFLRKRCIRCVNTSLIGLWYICSFIYFLKGMSSQGGKQTVFLRFEMQNFAKYDKISKYLTLFWFTICWWRNKKSKFNVQKLKYVKFGWMFTSGDSSAHMRRTDWTCPLSKIYFAHVSPYHGGMRMFTCVARGKMFQGLTWLQIKL